MKRELDAKLCHDFPEIFKDRHGDMTKTAMCWGFDCGDGWFDILYRTCQSITEYLKQNPEVPQVVAVQVKEKFGGLRFYVYGGDGTVWDMLDVAEKESYRTCESCGTKEDVSQNEGGWIKTLCTKCREAQEKEYEEYYKASKK